MIFLDLVLGFLRVGAFSFGGAYGAIPLIRDVVMGYGWMSDEELTYMIAVSESTPGPIMVNLATYIGESQAGLAGSLLATFSVVLPSFLVILLVAALMKNTVGNRYVKAMLGGVKPCIIGIVIATGVYMTLKSFLGLNDAVVFDLKSLLLAVFCALMMVIYKKIAKKRLSPILLIIISAICGVIMFS